MKIYYCLKKSDRSATEIWCNGSWIGTSTGKKRFHIKFYKGVNSLDHDLNEIKKELEVAQIMGGVYSRINTEKRNTMIQFKKLGLPFLVKFTENPYAYLIKSSASNAGVKFYPEFNLITVMADGFPLVRFVLSNDYKQVFHTFASNWRDNDKNLCHLSSPNCIPHIFPIEDLEKHIRKVVL